MSDLFSLPFFCSLDLPCGEEGGGSLLGTGVERNDTKIAARKEKKDLSYSLPLFFDEWGKR
jgi:hypothetical protein